MQSFEKLGLATWILKMCQKIEFQKPTKIQILAIPKILNGCNLAIWAETGSGKTATFGLPIVQKLNYDPYGVFALVITPSRELAIQISDQLNIFGQSINIRVATIIGGEDILKQLQILGQIPHIIVGTPGRINDLFQSFDQLQKYLKNLQFLVLDEADQLLENEGLFNDLKQICQFIPQKKQVIFTSATLIKSELNPEKLKICIDDVSSIEHISTLSQQKISPTITQYFTLLPDDLRDYYLIYILQEYKNLQKIVFVSTCEQIIIICFNHLFNNNRKCYFLKKLLELVEIQSITLYSLLSQKKRIKHLRKFRNNKVNCLIATDVASRGLDIQNVDLVINFQLPRRARDYVHRVGRTARKGKKGIAISFVSQYDVDLVLNIESFINEKLEEMKINEDKVLQDLNRIIKLKKKVKLQMVEDQIDLKFKEYKQKKLKNQIKFQQQNNYQQ